MNEREKEDQEQLEYLKRWQEKKKQKCKKMNVFRKILRKRKRSTDTMRSRYMIGLTNSLEYHKDSFRLQKYDLDTLL